MNQHQNSFPRLVGQAQVLRVAACILTCKRPQLLERCLDSVAGQILEWNIDLEIVVCINGDEMIGQTLAVIEAFRARSGRIPLIVERVRERNISKARNAAADRAVNQGAKYIWFLDDDATADPDCLANLMSPIALRYPVISGAVHYSFPDPLPYWVVDDRPTAFAGKRDFEPAKHAITNNVLFTADIWRKGFRFDPAYGETGGEDFEFFGRVNRAGYQIRKCITAIAREEYHRERLTWDMQMRRMYCEQAGAMRRLIADNGLPLAIARRLHSIILDAIKGGFGRGLALLVKPFDDGAYKRLALRGGRRLQKSRGRLVAIFGHVPKYYKAVQGS